MLELLDVAGTARERGRARGEALRDQVVRGLELLGVHPVGGDSYLRAATRWTPAAVEELRGIAEGAVVPFEEVLVFNLADELHVFGAVERCTSVALAGGGGVPVSGQTMDTPAWFSELRVAIRSVEPESGLTTIAFTIAGLLALCGVNSAGVAVWCNALYQLPSAAAGVPVSCLVRGLLSQPTVAQARELAESVPHASGQHYLLAGPDGAVSLECSAGATKAVEAQRLWHTNHPLTDIERTDDRAGRGSVARGAFAERTLARADSTDDLMALLSDRTVPVAKTDGWGGDGYTLWAAVVEHAAPPQVFASAGPPGNGPWQPVDVMRSSDRPISRSGERRP